MTITKNAYAKINLTLEILGTKRADGFHDIASIMHKAKSLYDTVTVSLTDSGINLECDKNVCAPTDNLAYKAAQKYIDKYTEKTGKTLGVDIKIQKNIPAGAGLAGGSSDAATVLDCLQELKSALSENEIDEIALSLGSDVPFCLEKHTCALCTGRGEEIRDLPALENIEVVFYLPKTPLSTKGIYGEYDKLYGDDYTKNKSFFMAEAIEKSADISAVLSYMCNDFQPLCEARCPEIKDGCKILANQGYFSQMSGSGSAVFGIKKI